MRAWLRRRVPPPVASLLHHTALIALVVGVLLGSLYGFARTWPPLVVVETGSMQHDPEASALGVLDIGDLALVRAAPSPEDVVTYVEGRAAGYATYGDYGDVVVYEVPGTGQGIIHRPLLRLLWNGTAGGFDVPDLLHLERGVDWEASRDVPFGLTAADNVTLHNVSFRDVSVTVEVRDFVFQVVAPRCTEANPCYVAMGDANAPRYDPFLLRHSWFLGVARGELPWVGLLNLVLRGTYVVGDPQVPANSWTSLGIALAVLAGVPAALKVVDLARGREGATEEVESGLESVVAALEKRWEKGEEDGEEP